MSQDQNQQPKSQVPNVAAPAAINTTDEKLNLLLQLLLSQEARKAETEQNLENARKARNAQRELSARTHVEKQLVKQARCRHMKGGKHGPKSGVTDYCVGLHTYINGENIIKCMICGMKWKYQDTVEFLVRYGKKIANHTKKGWNEANEMLAQSTNKPSSSEVPMDATRRKQENGDASIEL